MNLKRMLLLLALSAAISAVAGPQKVKTSVEKVTLFIDGAQVTRTRQVDLPAGNSTVVFTGLSPYLDDKSMQVSAKGPFTVTAVNRLFNHTDSLERSTRQKTLEQTLEETQRQLDRLKASREVMDAESELLKTNCSVANRNVATPLAAIRELNEYYAARLETLKSKTLSLDAEEEKINERRRQILAELVNLGGRQSDPMSEVEVRIEAPATCKASFTLTYYVRNAGWFPSYDIRSGGLSEPVEISYKANIFQNTGEEWKNVALTLSSSNPNTGSIAPKLQTWRLDYGLVPPRYNLNMTSNTVSGTVLDHQRKPLPGATVLIPGTTIGAVTDTRGSYSITVPNGASSLQFSYVGYIPRTERITGNTMNVVMQEDATKVDDVVVMGYGVSNQLAGAAPGVRIRGTAASDRKVAEVDFADFDAESAVMEVEQTQSQLGYEFEIRQPYTIPSDGRSRNREVRPAGRLYLPEHAEDRQGRLPRGGGHRLGETQPVAGRGERLFRKHVRRQEHPRSRSDERHTPLLDGPRPEHPHRTHQGERLFVAPRHRFEPDTDRGVEVLRAQHTPGTRRADARRPAARIAQQRHRCIGRGVERRPAGQGERHRHLETGAETRRAARTAPALRREISQRTQPDNRVTRRGEGNEKGRTASSSLFSKP